MKFYPTFDGSDICVCKHGLYLHDPSSKECNCCITEKIDPNVNKISMILLREGVRIIGRILKQNMLFEKERISIAQWREDVLNHLGIDDV